MMEPLIYALFSLTIAAAAYWVGNSLGWLRGYEACKKLYHAENEMAASMHEEQP